MERAIERHLKIANFSLLNLAYWTIGVLIIYLGSSVAIEGPGYTLTLTQIIIWPFSVWLSFWLLGYVAAQLKIILPHGNRGTKYLMWILASAIMGLLSSFLSPLLSILLVRLFTADQILWEQVFINPVLQPQSFLASSMLFFLYFILLELIGRYRVAKEQNIKSSNLMSELDDAQLNSLKMQMRPHFLFNALNTIAMMVRKERKNEAVEMISNLSEMLRISIADNDDKFSTVENEIDLVEKLLTIEQYRFEDRLTVEVEVNEDSKQCLLPTLIFQPLVENAFKHGVAKTVGPALVSIKCYKKGGKLILKVFNSGPGLPENWELQKSQNLGLANTSTRLAQIYGSDSKLIIEELDDGILVSIELPARK